MTNNSTYEVACCSVWASLTPYIQETTGIELDKCPTTAQSPTACVNHALMKRIIGSINPPLLTLSVKPDMYLIDTNVLFTETGISNIISWSLIGRTCTEDHQANTPTYYLEFNLLQQTLSLTRTGCEYEKILFTSMLGICIILLIFVMVIPLIFERKNTSNEDEQSSLLSNSTIVKSSQTRIPVFE